MSKEDAKRVQARTCELWVAVNRLGSDVTLTLTQGRPGGGYAERLELWPGLGVFVKYKGPHNKAPVHVLVPLSNVKAVELAEEP